MEQQCQDRAQECRKTLPQMFLLSCSHLLCHRRRKHLHLSSPSQAQLPALSRKSSCLSCPSSDQRVPQHPAAQLPAAQLPRSLLNPLRPLLIPLCPHLHLRTTAGRRSPQGRVSTDFTPVGFGGRAGRGGNGAGISPGEPWTWAGTE